MLVCMGSTEDADPAQICGVSAVCGVAGSVIS
jgi:hypothetical protein